MKLFTMKNLIFEYNAASYIVVVRDHAYACKIKFSMLLDCMHCKDRAPSDNNYYIESIWTALIVTVIVAKWPAHFSYTTPCNVFCGPSKDVTFWSKFKVQVMLVHDSTHGRNT